MKQNTSKETFCARERYFEEIEKKQQKDDYRFNIFLYVTIILFAIAGIVAIVEFSVKLGVLGTIAASVFVAGWLGAYTLIILQETSNKFNYPVEFSNEHKKSN